jgi:hypothetical protein
VLYRRMFVMDKEGGGAASTSGGTSAGSTSGGSGKETPPPADGGGKWYGNLPEADRGFIENKGYADLPAMINSHRNLETMLGVPKERLIKLPDKADAPEWADIHKRLGKPEKADDYTMPTGSEESFTKWARETFHGLNLTKAQGEQLATKIVDMVGSEAKKKADDYAAKSHEQFEGLKKEWGQAFDHKIDQAVALSQKLGISKEQYEAMERIYGVDGWARMLDGLPAKFGASMGEPEFHGSGGGGNPYGPMSPAAAQQRINELISDTGWFQKWQGGDADAKRLWTHLNKMAIGSAA